MVKRLKRRFFNRTYILVVYCRVYYCCLLWLKVCGVDEGVCGLGVKEYIKKINMWLDV